MMRDNQSFESMGISKPITQRRIENQEKVVRSLKLELEQTKTRLEAAEADLEDLKQQAGTEEEDDWTHGNPPK